MNDDDFTEDDLDADELDEDNFEDDDKELDQDFEKDLDDYGNLQGNKDETVDDVLIKDMTITVNIEAELRERLEQDDNRNLSKYLTCKQDDQKADTLADPKYDTRSKSKRNNLINTKRYFYASIMANLFYRAFCDEDHYIKSPKTRIYRAIVATRSKFH